MASSPSSAADSSPKPPAPRKRLPKSPPLVPTAPSVSSSHIASIPPPPSPSADPSLDLAHKLSLERGSGGSFDDLGLANSSGGYLATRTIAMPKDENMHGDIFGGFLMAEMDLAAAIAAGRHAKSRVVTVAVDKLVFKKAVKTGNTVSCYTWIKSVGRTSMVVKVLVICKDNVTGTVHEVTEGIFTMVSIDEHGKPLKVPAIV